MTVASRAILLVDDDSHLLEGMQRHLRRRYEITTATSGAAGLEVLRQDIPFAVIVADYHMPGMDGVSFLREARSIRPQSVSVMLTGQAHLDLAVSALHKAGIYRFLSKPCSEELLEMTLDDCLEQHRLITQERRLSAELDRANVELADRNRELERTLEQLSELNLQLSQTSRIDPLTGLLNRRAWSEAAVIEQERAKRQGLIFGVIMLDIDYFKFYNDRLGHQQGDNCLRAVAQRIQTVCRTIDVAGRYGGEEFIIASVAREAEGVQRLAERIHQGVWDLDIPHPGSLVAPRVTVSVGSAIGDSEGWEALAAKADEALYAAKKAGRNRMSSVVNLAKLQAPQ